MAKVDLNLNVQGMGNVDELNRKIAQLKAELADIKQNGLRTVFDEVSTAITTAAGKVTQLDSNMSKMKTSTEGTLEAVKKFADNQKTVTKAYADSLKASDKTAAKLETSIERLSKQTSVAAQNAKQMAKNFQLAETTYLDMENKLSKRQQGLLNRQLKNFENGKIDTGTFLRRARGISSDYTREYAARLSKSTMTVAARKAIQDEYKHEQKMYELESKGAKARADAAAKERESVAAVAQSVAITKQKVKAEEEVVKKKQEQVKTAEVVTAKERARQARAESQQRVQATREDEYYKQLDAAETLRNQKLEKNQRARMILQEQMQAMASNTYEMETRESQKLALSLSRLSDTVINVRNFAETEGRKGTVGAQATSMLRTEQFYSNIFQYASAWKRVNSEEGKAADTLGRMIKDVKGLQSGINGVHTAFGQLASTVSAVRGIGTELRKTLTSMVQPITNIVSQVTSTAFKSSLGALKNLELAEIGFGNFYGQSAVSGIIGNVKQEALLSPLSAAQLASYVNQIAPLSKGNSKLAIDATMGVAKMIQYSGGEVTTEMEYVIKNLRDVIAKGKALTIDIRQFNRAMPALTKVLEEMGETELVKNGELTIDEEHAPKLLEAFQKINEYGDVGTIFESTSETISGLMERVEEQIQFLLIDVGEFSGLTKLIKDTISDFLNDSDGLLQDIKMSAQFIGRDVVSWLKSRDWERVLNIAKEVMSTLWNGLKESFDILKSALGGSDWRDTLTNLAELLSSFIKGIANSYSWLLGVMNTLNKSGILGSGLLQGAMGVFGFLSGNAGTIITGLLRGIGTALGTVEKALTIVITGMTRHQAVLLQTATTVSTFEEALLIASKTLSNFATDLLEIDTILGGVLTVEQRRMLQGELATTATQRETLAKEANAVASRTDAAAAEIEAQMRELNIAATKEEASAKSSGLLGPATNGSGGTKLGQLLGGVLKATIVGGLVASIGGGLTENISTAFGADKYGAANAGNIVGSVGGFASGGAVAGAAIGSIIPGLGTGIGAAIGGIGGAVVGAIKSGFESAGILDQARKDELEAFKSEVNNGTYLKEMLSAIEHGNDLTSDQFDDIKAKMVQEMNQWSESMPNGTAQMLKDYLTNIEFNGRSLQQTVEAAAQEDAARADTLWEYVKNDEVEKGNDYAATLQSLGWSNYKIAATIFGKAATTGEGQDKTIDYLLKWGSVQDLSGNDLTYDAVRQLEGADKQNIKDQLTKSWLNIGMESVENLDMDTAEKREISQKFADAMVKFIMGGAEEMTDSEMLRLHRFFVTGNISNVSEQVGLDLSPSGIQGGIWNKDKYGITADNIDIWASDYKGHGAEDENGNPLGSSTYKFPEGLQEAATKGMSAQEAWQWPEEHYKDYGLSTKNVIDEWKQSLQPKVEEQTAIDHSVENTLWQIRDNTNLLVGQNNTAQQQFEAFKASLPQLQQQQNKANGGIVYLAAGGRPRGVDIVPAMLQPGEYVVRRSAVERVGLSALNALNTGNLGYFARAMGRQNIYGDYSNARTWNSTTNDNRSSKRTFVKVINNSKGARLNRYYSLANRLG